VLGVPQLDIELTLDIQTIEKILFPVSYEGSSQLDWRFRDINLRLSHRFTK